MRRLPLMMGIGLALTCAAWAAPAANVVANGDFEAGTAGWTLSQQEGAKARLTTPTGDSPAGGRAASIKIQKRGLVQHLQLRYVFPTTALSPGEAYELSFLARATEPSEMPVMVINASRPWNVLGMRRTAALSGEWQEFRFPFRARESDQDFACVDFFLGQCRGTVWLDAVRLVAYTRRPALADGPKLEGGSWRLELTKSGAVARFIHKPSGEHLLLGSADDPVYELIVRDDAKSRILTSADATGYRTERIRRTGATRWTYFHDDLEVVLVVERTEDDLAALSISIVNRGDAAVTSATYPILRAPIRLGESSEDDVILLPAFDGGVVENPMKNVPAAGGGFTGAYPGPLSCQLLAYYDGTAGLYLAAHDPEGHPKQFALQSDVDFTFRIRRLAPMTPGTDVEAGYPVVLGAFSGDWHDAADIYRNWSHRQPWCQRPLTAEGKTPDWLKGGALVVSFDPHWAPDAETLTAHLDRFKTRYNTPLIVNNRGWERYGMWTGQEYFPAYPSDEAFREAAALIRKSYGRGMIMLSGYRWTIEKKQRDGSVYSSAERFRREVEPFVVFDVLGKEPLIGTSDRLKDWRGQRWATLCRATEFAKRTIVDVAKRCVQDGYSVIHFDQEVSGNYGAAVCGSRDHGHPPGDGRWIHLAMADLYERIRRECEPLDAGFALSMEEPNELYLPHLNLCQCRPYGVTPEWPGVRPMTRTVPLFSYLYHDYLIQWAAFYPWKSAGHRTYSLAKGFSAGLMPGLQPDKQTLPEKGDTPYSTLFSRCMAAYIGFAHDYLMFGRMRKPLDINVPTRTLSLGKKWGHTTAPAVFNSVWECSDGRIGVVFINPEEEAHKVAADLTSLRARREPAHIRVTAGQGSHEIQGSTFAADIAPLDIVLIELLP